MERASCGGSQTVSGFAPAQTASAASVWPDRAAPYLVSVADPSCARDGRAWEQAVKWADLARVLHEYLVPGLRDLLIRECDSLEPALCVEIVDLVLVGGVGGRIVETEAYDVDGARKLLAEAGYPNGIDAKTGAPLVLYLDVTARGAEAKSILEWYQRQFEKINLQLQVRPTDYNRFQDKIRKGNAQIFEWGWHADYPDPENFLFLLHGAQSKVKTQGENAANYASAEFDRLFVQMKDMDNGLARQAVIDRMVAIVRRDALSQSGVGRGRLRARR